MAENENGDQPRERRRGRYPKEFRRDAAALVIDQRRTIVDVARELGVVEQTLGNWVRQERIDRGEREGTSSEDKARISELEGQVKRLTNERDLLKRSVAFWGRSQPVIATSSVNFSDGFMNSSVARGRLLRLAANRARSSALCTERSVPFGMY